MEIYREARQIQLDSGNLHQWKDGYPSEDIIRSDLERGYSWAMDEEGTTVGVFALIYGEDPTYKKIYDGAWISEFFNFLY